MIDEAQVRTITKKVLDEEHLLGHIKIFEKEHNLFRGSHDKIQLPAALNIPDQIINQIVEKFDTQLTEGSIPFIDEDNHFTEDNDVFFYDEEKEILCLGLNSPETDMVGGFIMKEGTPPTQDIADCFQAYAMDTPLERLTDGGLESWASSEDPTYWTEFDDGGLGDRVNREASEVHDGTYSCKLTTTAGGDYAGMTQNLILNPGYNCRIAIWYIRPAHASSVLRLYLYDDGPNVYLQDDATWDTPANFFDLPVADVWTLFELDFVAHANYTNYTVKIYKSHSAGGAISFYVDDVSVSENRNVVPYFRTEAGIIIGLNQDMRTTASVVHSGLTLTGFDGILKAVDGVVTEAADHVDLANITANQHHNQAHTLASHTTKAHAELTNVTANQHHNQIHASTHHLGGGDPVNHDNLTGFAINEHRVWEASIAQDVHDDNIPSSAITQHEGDIDHDALTNTHDLTSDIDHGSIAGLADVGDHAWAAVKTTANWNKSIGSGGDYADWATMIAAMPDLIAHSVTVTIKAGTTLTATCDIRNKHGLTSAAMIGVDAEKYFPTAGALPTADSATATTLRDAALAAAALGNDYFNGCWIRIINGTGTDNGFVLITDYIDATGDVVVAAWPGTQPDNTSRYIIVGALIDGGGTISNICPLTNNTVPIYYYGIGFTDDDTNSKIHYNSFVKFYYCVFDKADYSAISSVGNKELQFWYCGLVENNTANDASEAGLNIYSTNRVYLYKCGISLNNRRGVKCEDGSYAIVRGCFGSGNVGNGLQSIYSGMIYNWGSTVVGTVANVFDPGTADTDSSDQAVVY
jgi:hypothetical protein